MFNGQVSGTVVSPNRAGDRIDTLIRAGLNAAGAAAAPVLCVWLVRLDRQAQQDLTEENAEPYFRLMSMELFPTQPSPARTAKLRSSIGAESMQMR